MENTRVQFEKTLQDFSGNQKAFNEAKKAHDDKETQRLADLEDKAKEDVASTNTAVQPIDLLTVNGKFTVETTESGARQVQFTFEHNGQTVSATMAGEGSFAHARIVMQALKAAKAGGQNAILADCYVGAPNGVRKNYQLFSITDTSLMFDFDINKEQAAEIALSGAKGAQGLLQFKDERSALRNAKADRRALWA